MAATFGRRFDELCKQAATLDASKRPSRDRSGEYEIEYSDLLNWKVKVRHLLATVCGTESQHFTQFVKHEEASFYSTYHEVLLKLRAILEAAKDDFEGGYLNSLKFLVQSEVFDTELEQATELLASGYVSPAAVVAGVVLETGLREMCVDAGLSIGKLDKMNADLAKAGIYNKLIQKQITALADIRNNAAHGHPDKFTNDDVAGMIKDVQRILSNRST